MVISDKDLDKIQAMITSTFRELLSHEFEEMIAKHVSAKVKSEMTGLSKTISSMNKEIDDLKVKNKQMASMLESNEQSARSHNLRIFGLKQEENQDLRKVVLNLFNNKMKLGIKDSEINKCYRVSTKKQTDKPIPVLVGFYNSQIRTTVLANRKQLKIPGIAIKEDLTKYRLNLFQSAVSRFTSKNAWVLHGNVYVRSEGKVYRINDESELDDIGK